MYNFYILTTALFCHKINSNPPHETVQSHSTSQYKAVKNYIFPSLAFMKVITLLAISGN